MKIHQAQQPTKTSSPPDFVDITSDVQSVVAESDIASGHVFVSSPEGCSIVVNEFESGLLSDLKSTFDRVVTNRDKERPSFGASSVVLPAEDGKLRLGMWQRVLLVELDEPNERVVSIQIVGE